MLPIFRTTALMTVSAALLAGCHKPYTVDGPEGYVRLKVEATWQGQPLQAGEVHLNVSDYRTQVHRVWHTARYPSHLVLPVLR